MNDQVVYLFGEIANAFHWPVAAALLVLLVYVVMDVGAIGVEAWRRRAVRGASVDAMAATVDRAVANPGSASTGLDLPPAAQRVWSSVEGRLQGDPEHFDLWLDEAVREEELALSARLDRGRAIVRLGPMLGLAGTIIPLGPALQSLFGGDMASMIDHLVFGFGAVVCGLVASGVAYVLTLVRERWARIELKAVEDVAELALRALARRQEGRADAAIRTA